ncbi:hypothetical protein [Paracoccus sp. AK26]|uniref:hypothetical protein n=1 Tax=Paracoccus sp. AK26 TaxID=2589076 RepID=UPI00142811B3|nr:hypothetical protein [Paracoccus sp. AK26]QIR86521.1 hypothetical protein FIU66_14510 [Paracoccus sp. AK26]
MEAAVGDVLGHLDEEGVVHAVRRALGDRDEQLLPASLALVFGVHHEGRKATASGSALLVTAIR